MIPKKTKVFFNGNWVGFTDNPDTVVDIFKSIRRKQKIEGVSVVRDIINKEIRIYTDLGRGMRPLFLSKKNQEGVRSLNITKSRFHALLRHTETNVFQKLVEDGYIEFLDVEEEEGSLIAFDIEDFY